MVFFLSDFNLHISDGRIQFMVFAALAVDSHLKVRVFHFIFILQTQKMLKLVLKTDHLVLDRADFLLHLDHLVVFRLKFRGSGLNESVHFINFGLLS